ncbi:hypothetical protein ACH0C8_15985, partial [Acetobacter lovaniensis]|uniref:hypothetical protein n=1 Tax=Acetobacter lovaniensis TaxID=104100 RepID=UPI00376FB93F
LNLATHAYANHFFSYEGKTLAWPLSLKAREYAKETKINLHHAKPPSAIKMYVLYGANIETPYNMTYPVAHQDWQPRDLLCEEYGCPEDNC